MRVRILNNTEELEAFSQEWNGLLRRSENDAVELSHEWILSWWKCFGQTDRLHVVLVSNTENELIGIAPMKLGSSFYRRIGIRKMSLLANGHSPSCDIIARKGYISAVVQTLFDHIGGLREWDVLDFSKMSVDSPVYREILSRLDSRYPYGIKESIDSPYVRMDADWSSFLYTRSSKFRKVLRNKLNRSNKAGDLTYEKIAISDSGHPALASMLDISARSWKRTIGRDLRKDLRSRQFHLYLSDAFGPRNMVHLWLLKKKNAPIAFEFHLEYNKVVYPIRADYDETYKDISPGSLLEHHILKSCFESKSITEYYSCGDDYQYLLNWTDEVRRHVNIEVFNSGVLLFGLHALEYRFLPVLRKLHINQIGKYLSLRGHGYNSSAG